MKLITAIIAKSAGSTRENLSKKRGFNMNYKKTLTVVMTAPVITAFVAFVVLKFEPQKVQAFNPQPDPPGFGIFGISESQIMKINVVNTALAPSAETPPDPCRVSMTFLDQNGNVLTRSDGTVIKRVAQLTGGQSISLAVDASNFIRGGATSASSRCTDPASRRQRYDATGSVYSIG
jgi:hypothetical protein